MSLTKIAFLSVFPPFRGGIAQFNQELVKAFSNSAQLGVFNFSRQYPQFLFPGKSQLVDRPDEIQFESQVVLDSINPLSYFKAAKKINEFQPDILLIPYWMPFFAPALGKVASKVNANRKIALLHNVIPHERRFFDPALNRYFLKQFDAFIVLSQTVADQLKSYLPEARFILIPHPLYRHFGTAIPPVEAKRRLGLSPDRKVLLFFGFIRKYKGLDLLLQALKYLKENVQVLIAGESYMDYEEIKRVISKEGIAQDQLIEHVRFIDEEEVKVFFSAANICVLPYRTATQSGIAAIAKHFETPMVVTPVGELPNEVMHQSTGYVCQSVSASALAEGISDTLLHESEYRENQRAWNEQNTFERFAEKTLDFIT